MKSDKDTPLVSILMPFLNLEKFINEAIESVLGQTYENWELILVNDGSTDNSTIIAKDYTSRYPEKVRYIEHENLENKGISASRNRGFQESKGKFLAFLDADDIYLPSKLEEQVSLLLQYPDAGMMYASTHYWFSWSGNPEDAKWDWTWKEFGVEPDSLIKPPQLLTIFLKNGGTVPCMGSLMVRREAIEDIGGWENSFRDIYEDQIFYAKISFKWPVFVSSKCWDKYRQHPNSICRIVEKTGQANLARRTYLLWLEKYLFEKEVDKNAELWKALEKALWPFRHAFFHSLNKFKNKAIKKIRQYATKN